MISEMGFAKSSAVDREVRGVYCISLSSEMQFTALTGRFNCPLSSTTFEPVLSHFIPKFPLYSASVSDMSGFMQFEFAEEVALTNTFLQEYKNIVTGFRFRGITSCSIFVALTNSEADFGEAIEKFFGIDRAKGIEHRLQAATFSIIT